MHPNTHSSIRYNSQVMEPTEMFINRWMDKEVMVHTHTGIWVSHKKNEILLFATMWMDLESIGLSEMSGRKWQILYDITYMWNWKIKETNVYNKTETDSWTQ